MGLGHEHLEIGEVPLGDGAGHGALDAALLHADVDDVAHIAGQRQLQVGLDHEERDTERHGEAVALEEAEHPHDPHLPRHWDCCRWACCH